MLDCQTEKGKVYISHEDWTANWIEERAKGKTKLRKFKELTSRADRLAYSISGAKQALLEIKSRNMTLNQLNNWGNEYLISEHKINKCQKISIKYKIPFFVFVNLIDDKYILRLKVLNNKGEFVIPYRIEYDKETQDTCNGGTKLDNVYMLKVSPDNIIPK